MTKVNIYEAKTRLSALLALVQQGQEVIISKAGKPVARLVPYEDHSKAPRLAGRLQGEGQVGPGFFEPLPEDFRAFFE